MKLKKIVGITTMPVGHDDSMKKEIASLKDENSILRSCAKELEEEIGLSPDYADKIAKDEFLTQHQRLLLARLYILVCITDTNFVKEVNGFLESGGKC